MPSSSPGSKPTRRRNRRELSGLPPRHLRLHRLLPVTAVELLQRDGGKIDIVEAARIDVDLVRVGARYVERMHAAVLAEGVLRDPGVERVGGEVVAAAQELEPLGRH